jgi:hypothetical protein
LNTLRLHAKAYRVPNKAGVYLMPFSDTVACKLSSTIGTSDDAMGRGLASMQLSLVSRVTGQTLNKKAQGQSHFKRTINWKKTWAEGVERMRDAYAKSAGFYDALAAIEDRDQYKIDVMTAIESIPDWRNNNILADFHAIAAKDGILTLKQVDLLDRTLDRERGRNAPTAPVAPPKPIQEAPKAEDPLLPILRALYSKARAVNNDWLMEFTKSVADQVSRGRSLSPKQMDIIDRSRAQFKVASGSGLDWTRIRRIHQRGTPDSGYGRSGRDFVPDSYKYTAKSNGFTYQIIIPIWEDQGYERSLLVGRGMPGRWSYEDILFKMLGNITNLSETEMFQAAEKWHKEVEPTLVKAPAEKHDVKHVVKHVVDSATQEKLTILDELEPKIQNWPDAERAIKALRAAYETGAKPDDDDLKRVRNALYKAGMRPQADHFRMASSKMVATRYLATLASS